MSTPSTGRDEPPRGAVEPSAGAEGRCPICDGPLFGWVRAPEADVAGGETFVLDRCERCGAGVTRSSLPHPTAGGDPGAALEQTLAGLVVTSADGERRELRAPNRRSLQAAIGEGRWAALELPRRPLQLTPAALAEISSRGGLAAKRIRFPLWGRNQLWMWQTLINALTLHPNFAREALAGRLRPSGGRGRAAFALDALVSLLAAPLVALLSVPLETLAALARRGGEMRAELEPVPQPATPDTA